jgi:hypothetical protein
MDAPAFSITHVIENGACCKSRLQQACTDAPWMARSALMGNLIKASATQVSVAIFSGYLPLKIKKTGNRTTVFVHGQPMDGLLRA